MTTNKTIAEILLEKFYVYRNSESGQYHNGRQEDGVVPFTEATQAITQAMLDIVGEDDVYPIPNYSTHKISHRNELRAEIRTAIKKMGGEK